MRIIEVLHDDFKRLQAVFAESLLAHPRRQERGAVRLLVVRREVLDVGIHAPLRRTVDLAGGEQTGQHRIFGVVLEVATGERTAVQVHGRAVPAVIVRVGELLPHCRADFRRDFLAPRLRHQHFSGILRAGRTGDVVGQTGRAVAVRRCHLADGFNRRSFPAAGVDQRLHVVDGQLVKQQLPLFVVVVLAREVSKRQAVLRAGRGHHVVRIVIRSRVVLDRGDGADDLDVVLGQLVFAVSGGGNRFLIVGEMILAGERRVVARHIAELVDGGLLVGRTPVDAVIHVAVKGEGLAVQHGMRVGAHGHGVFARFEDVAAVFRLDALGIVGCHIFQRHGERHRLGRAGLKHLGFLEVNQVDGCLLDAAIGVRRRVVEFHRVLARDIARVRHLDGHGHVIAIALEVGDFLRERGVAQAVAERVLHRCAVINQPFFRRRLIELVAHVNAFHIVHEGDNAVERVVKARQLLHQVLGGVPVVAGAAGMIPRRGLRQVIKVGVRGVAGGVDAAVQDFAQRRHARRARAGGKNDRADVVVVIHPAEFHRVVGIDDDDDVLEVRRDQIHQILLALGELEVVVAGLELIVVIGIVVERRAGVVVVVRNRLLHLAAAVIRLLEDGAHVAGQVRILAAAAGNHDHRRVGEGLRLAHDFIRVVRRRRFG